MVWGVLGTGGMLVGPVGCAGSQPAAHRVGVAGEDRAGARSLGEPGPEHALLARLVGDWAVEMDFEGREPVRGTATNAWTLDGRFLETGLHIPDYHGRELRGRGISGYDRVRGAFVNVWMNSLSTQITVRTGMAEGDAIVYEGTSYRRDGTHTSRVVMRVEGEDRYTETVFDRGEDGSWARRGRVTFTR